jgi:hypothetical protein
MENNRDVQDKFMVYITVKEFPRREIWKSRVDRVDEEKWQQMTEKYKPTGRRFSGRPSKSCKKDFEGGASIETAKASRQEKQ